MKIRYILYFIIIALIAFPSVSFSHSSGKPHIHDEEEEKAEKVEEKRKRPKKKEDTRIEVILKPFQTAKGQLLVSKIDINATRGSGDVTFKNNTPKHIILIYGRVYVYEEIDGKKQNFVLLNNPNKPAILLSDTHHSPGKEAIWRFDLLQSLIREGSQFKYTIDINSKSLYFE